MSKCQLPVFFLVLLFAFSELNCGGGSQGPLNVSASSVSSKPSSGNGTSPGGSSGTSPSGGASGTVSGTSSSGGGSSNTPGTTISNLHQKGGWTGYGELPSSYVLCTSCSPNGPRVTWSMQQGVNSPSLSGSSSKFSIGGQMQYSDVIWINHVIGDLSSQGLPDSDHKIVSATHNFVYDVYFFGTDLSKSEALEFDINQYIDGESFIWGHQCRIANGNSWDISVNNGMKWQATNVACNPKNNDWNHVTIQVQRTSDDRLLFQTITLNGQTATLNYKEDPGSAGSWHGITLNYQEDGNYAQQPYSVYLDKLNFTYW